MFDRQLRLLKARILVPSVRLLARILTPVQLTVLGLVAGLASAVVLALQGPLIAAFLLWTTNRLADGVDGEVARERGEQSDYGGYLDIMADVITYAAIPVGLALRLADPHTSLAVLVMIAFFYVNITSWSYLAALLEKRRAASTTETTSVNMPRGVIEGAETMLLYSVIILWPQTTIVASWFGAGAALLSIAWRMLWAHRVLRN